MQLMQNVVCLQNFAKHVVQPLKLIFDRLHFVT